MSETKETGDFKPDSTPVEDIIQEGSADENAHGEGHVNLNNNVSAKIKNPLVDIPTHTLLREVDEFARSNDLGNPELFERAALTAKDPANFESVDGILDEEADAIRNEVLHKWRQPWSLYFTVIVCSIGAAVQGWDQTGSNGANLSFPKEFGIDDTDGNQKNQWLVGVVNSGPYLGASFIGCWLSDPLNNYLGRRGTIFLAAIFCFVTPIGSGFTKSWPQLFVCRLLLGIGMGAKNSTVSPYCAENAPATIRGGLTMTWQLWTAIGIFLGFSANLAVKDTGKIAWRLQLGSAFIPAFCLMCLVYFCPESPRWLIKKQRYNKAYKSLLRLRNHPIQAARDLILIKYQVELEAELVGKTNYVSRFVQLFTVPRLRRATLASFVLMIGHELCGINIISFYSSSVFTEAGSTQTEALFASWGFGICNVVFALPAIWTIDTYGRRSLLLFTFPHMAYSLLAAGFCFWIKESQAHLGMVAFFIYLFTAWYSPGEGPVPYVYCAEVFPLSHREVGMAFGVATTLFWAAVLSVTFPAMKAAMTPTGAFGFYAGLNVLTFVMIFFWVPETKQRTLEELDYIFAVPTRKFMYYQTFKVLPWWVKRYIFRRKDAYLEPLYKFDIPPPRKSFDEKEEVRNIEILDEK